MKGLEINGYFTIVENEILDLLPIIGLTKRELEFMIVIVRKTNGFGKERDKISLSQFEGLTGINKGDCSRTLRKLIDKRIIDKSVDGIGVNRDFGQWEGVGDLPTRKGLAKYQRKVGNLHNKGVGNLSPSKETLKETFKRKVLSKSEREEKKKEYKKGLAMLKEAIKRSPDRKRKT